MASEGSASRTADSWCSALSNPPWWSTRMGASVDTAGSCSDETACDTSTAGVVGTAGPVRAAHQARLMPSTSPQHPAVARTRPSHPRRGCSVPTLQARPPGHHARDDRHLIRCRTRACWRWAMRSSTWRWKSGGADVWNKRNKARVRWGVQGGPSCGDCMRVLLFIGLAKLGLGTREMAFDRSPTDVEDTGDFVI